MADRGEIGKLQVLLHENHHTCFIGLPPESYVGGGAEGLNLVCAALLEDIIDSEQTHSIWDESLNRLRRLISTYNVENDTVRKRYLPVIWARYESRGSHPADLCHLTRLVEWRERYQEALAFRREYLDLLILTHSEGGESVDEDALGKLWNTLGKRYEIGDGVERNTSRALQCHRQAAELRNVESMSVYWRLSRACGPGPGLEWMTISARLGNKDAQFYLALEAERAIAMNGGVNDGDEPDGHTLQGTKSNDGSGDALNNEEVNRQSESSFDSNDSATRVLASLDRLIVPENPSLSEYHPIAPTLTERIGNDGAGVNANHNDCFSLLQEVIAGQKLDGEARKQARIAIHKSTQLAADGELAEACLHMGHRARDYDQGIGVPRDRYLAKSLARKFVRRVKNQRGINRGAGFRLDGGDCASDHEQP